MMRTATDLKIPQQTDLLLAETMNPKISPGAKIRTDRSLLHGERWIQAPRMAHPLHARPVLLWQDYL
jgi:hypothetical protein